MVWEGLEDIGGGWMGGWEGSLSRPVSSNGKDDGGGGGGGGLSNGVSWGHTGQRHTTLKIRRAKVGDGGATERHCCLGTGSWVGHRLLVLRSVYRSRCSCCRLAQHGSRRPLPSLCVCVFVRCRGCNLISSRFLVPCLNKRIYCVKKLVRAWHCLHTRRTLCSSPYPVS